MPPLGDRRGAWGGQRRWTWIDGQRNRAWDLCHPLDAERSTLPTGPCMHARPRTRHARACMHASTRPCTPQHALARPSTPVHARARPCISGPPYPTKSPKSAENAIGVSIYSGGPPPSDPMIIGRLSDERRRLKRTERFRKWKTPFMLPY